MEVPRRIRKPATVVAVVAGLALAGCTAQEEAPTPAAQETTYDTESGLAPEVQAMLYDHLNTSLQIMRDDISDAESLAFAIVGTNFYNEHIVNVTNPSIVENPNSLTISVNDGAERLKTPVEIALTRMIDSEKSESNRYTDIYDHLLANSNNPHDALYLAAKELEDVLGIWFVSNGFKANEIEFADLPIADLEQILQGNTPLSMLTMKIDGTGAESVAVLAPGENFSDGRFANPDGIESGDKTVGTFANEEERAKAFKEVEDLLSGYGFEVNDMPVGVMGLFAQRLHSDPSYAEHITGLAEKYPRCLPYVLVMPFKDSFPEYEAQPFDGDIVELEDIDKWPEAVQELPHDKSEDPQTCPAIAIHP